MRASEIPYIYIRTHRGFASIASIRTRNRMRTSHVKVEERNSIKRKEKKIGRNVSCCFCRIFLKTAFPKTAIPNRSARLPVTRVWHGTSNSIFTTLGIGDLPSRRGRDHGSLPRRRRDALVRVPGSPKHADVVSITGFPTNFARPSRRAKHFRTLHDFAMISAEIGLLQSCSADVPIPDLFTPPPDPPPLRVELSDVAADVTRRTRYRRGDVFLMIGAIKRDTAARSRDIARIQNIAE